MDIPSGVRGFCCYIPCSIPNGNGALVRWKKIIELVGCSRDVWWTEGMFWSSRFWVGDAPVLFGSIPWPRRLITWTRLWASQVPTCGSVYIPIYHHIPIYAHIVPYTPFVPQKITIYRWYKPFPHGWLIVVAPCLTHMSRCFSLKNQCLVAPWLSSETTRHLCGEVCSAGDGPSPHCLVEIFHQWWGTYGWFINRKSQSFKWI